MISSGGGLTFITWCTPIPEGRLLPKQRFTKQRNNILIYISACPILFCSTAVPRLTPVWAADECKDRIVATLSPRNNYREQESANNQTANGVIIGLVCRRRKQANGKSCISTSVDLFVISHNKVNCKLEGNIVNHTGRLPNFHRALAANWCRLIKEHRNL